MNDPRAHKCAICGAANASRGYRMAGPWSQIAKRAYLWSCTKPQCLDAAEIRWSGANASPLKRDADTPPRAADVQPQPGPGGQIHAGSHDPRQGALI